MVIPFIYAPAKIFSGMKYIVVLGDGMADRPLKSLGGKTCLEKAHKPGMDYIAEKGRMGLLRTLREDMPLGSDIANLSVLGYDPKKYYSGGRGPLEAAAMGVPLDVGDIAFRANLITVEDGRIKDYSGGHVSSEESAKLISSLDKNISSRDMRLYPGVSYRNLLVLKNSMIEHSDLEETPPHDIMGQKAAENLIKAKNTKAQGIADMLNGLMTGSQALLEQHPVNQKRLLEKKDQANMLWIWGGGSRPKMPAFFEKYGVKGGLISAVDLLRGIAVYAGLEVISVPGATGYLDTDYSAKAECALKSLDKNDYVYIHVEAPDEAGHEGLVEEKIKAIEDIDEKIVSRILEEMEGKEYKMAVLPDHATPIDVRTHTSEPVPFAIYSSPGGKKGDGIGYSEKNAANGSYGLIEGRDFMDLLIYGKIRKK
jgi:2,3-bisphosphoglycerate-independent phosphoglycerate mutase